MKRWLTAMLLCASALAAGQTHAQVTREAIRKQAAEQEPLALQTLKNLVEVESGSRDLEGLARVRAVIEDELAAAGVKTDLVTPILLPSYAPKDVKKRQLVKGGNALPGASVVQNRLHEEKFGA